MVKHPWLWICSAFPSSSPQNNVSHLILYWTSVDRHVWFECYPWLRKSSRKPSCSSRWSLVKHCCILFSILKLKITQALECNDIHALISKPVEQHCCRNGWYSSHTEMCAFQAVPKKAAFCTSFKEQFIELDPFPFSLRTLALRRKVYKICVHS